MREWGRRPSTDYLVERSHAGGEKLNNGLERSGTPFVMLLVHLNLIPAAANSA